MKSTLVVFYSLSGNTRRLAQEIVKQCDCDVEEIKDLRRRVGTLGWIRSGYQAWARRLPPIQSMNTDPLRYDLVIIGSPVWVGTMASPVRSYIVRNRRKFNRIALFCTFGGRDAEQCLTAMAQACGKTPVASLSLNERELKSDAHSGKIQDFAQTLRKLAAPGSQSAPPQQHSVRAAAHS